MHVLFLAPDTHIYNHGFLHGLKSIGARVSGIGPGPREALRPGARRLLDDYRQCAHMLDHDRLTRRRFMGNAAVTVAGLGGASVLLSACGDDDEGSATAGSTSPQAASLTVVNILPPQLATRPSTSPTSTATSSARA